ncbi:MAG: acylneuraminate cytidylyltransferase family protein [Synergistaceae bacterium]|nr:acylneuraminate cytidylyltransferase family protein [Synergistaceae bacterium]
MMNIAIIPARSGSKGVKDKNIRPLGGRPLMAWSIEAALESEEFDEVMVSTDSERYAEIAREYGASVPFLRSPLAASDTASSWDTIKEVLKGYEDLGRNFDTFCLLQPTSPLRTAEDIRNAYALCREKNAFAVVSVCEAEHSPLWCGQIPDTLELDGFIRRESGGRRQDAGKFYRLNGAIYIANIEESQRDPFLYREGSYAYIMPSDKSIDIDTELDFKFAEFLTAQGKRGAPS